MAEGWEDAEFKTKAGDIVVNKDPSGLVTGGTAALTGAAPALTALGKTGLNIGATGAAQALAAAPAYFSKPARESRQRYQDLLDAQKAGKLGWTPQQQRQMMGEALRSSQAATKDIEAKLRREAAALGGTGRSGRSQEVLADIAKQRMEVIPQVAAKAELLSQQQTKRLTDKIDFDTEAKRKELKKDLTQAAALALKQGDGLKADILSYLMDAISGTAASEEATEEATEAETEE